MAVSKRRTGDSSSTRGTKGGEAVPVATVARRWRVLWRTSTAWRRWLHLCAFGQEFATIVQDWRIDPRYARNVGGEVVSGNVFLGGRFFLVERHEAMENATGV
jgi:hypothetical protein